VTYDIVIGVLAAGLYALGGFIILRNHAFALWLVSFVGVAVGSGWVAVRGRFFPGGALALLSLIAVLPLVVDLNDEGARDSEVRAISAIDAGIRLDLPTDDLPVCPTVTGSGEIPDGADLWMVVRQAEGGNYHLSSKAVQQEESRWHTRPGEVNLGVGSSEEVGGHWLIYAVLFDDGYSDYLEALRVAFDGQVNDLRGSFSGSPPPGISESPMIEVTRGSANNC
jgi:hypothetical protein